MKYDRKKGCRGWSHPKIILSGLRISFAVAELREIDSGK
jgi:hypothetical protein